MFREKPNPDHFQNLYKNRWEKGKDGFEPIIHCPGKKKKKKIT